MTTEQFVSRCQSTCADLALGHAGAPTARHDSAAYFLGGRPHCCDQMPPMRSVTPADDDGLLM